MHVRPIAAALLTLAVLLPGPAPAQSIDDINKAEAALDAAWAQLPLTIRHATFVTAAPTGYGVYTARPDAKFKPGERIVAYAEPLGYAWKTNADGTYTFGFDVDVAIEAADGTELQKQPNFAHLAFTSHARNHEFMVTLDLDLTGAEPGNYIAAYTLRDIASSKTATISLPFSIVQ